MNNTRTIKAGHLWPGMILDAKPYTRIYDVRPYGLDKEGEPIVEVVYLYHESLTMRASNAVEIVDEV